MNPAYGKAAVWSGGHDSNHGLVGIQNIIGITDNDFQPIGTVLAQSTGAPMTQYGQSGGFDPEQVLYRCDASDVDSLYESYSNNGDDYYSGRRLVTEAGSLRILTCSIVSVLALELRMTLPVSI